MRLQREQKHVTTGAGASWEKGATNSTETQQRLLPMHYPSGASSAQNADFPLASPLRNLYRQRPATAALSPPKLSAFHRRFLEGGHGGWGACRQDHHASRSLVGRLQVPCSSVYLRNKVRGQGRRDAAV